MIQPFGKTCADESEEIRRSGDEREKERREKHLDRGCDRGHRAISPEIAR
jgi:hypothetical protein